MKRSNHTFTSGERILFYQQVANALAQKSNERTLTMYGNPLTSYRELTRYTQCGKPKSPHIEYPYHVLNVIGSNCFISLIKYVHEPELIVNTVFF